MSTLYRAAGIVFAFNLLSKLLGFVRDAALAAFFGASAATDAYLVGYSLPFSVQNVMGMAFLLVMVPLLTKNTAAGTREKAYRLASEVMSRLAIILVVLVGAGMVFADPLIRLFAPGFGPVLRDDTVYLMRIMLPAVFFMGFAMLFSGILNGQKKFALAAFGPGAVNLIVIASIALSGRFFDIRGVAVGTLGGFVVFCLILYGGVHRQGFRFRRPTPATPAVRAIGRDILAVMLSVSIGQVFLMIGRGFGSLLAPGSITAYELANRIITLPVGILAAALVTATYPLLAECAAQDDRQGMLELFSKTIRSVLLFMMPASVGMALLRTPLVRLLYERGGFGSEASAMTADILLFFSVALVSVSLTLAATRAFYAMGDYRTPVRAGLAAIALELGVAWLAVGRLGPQGLALSYVAASYLYMILLLVGFYRAQGAAVDRRILVFAAKSAAASAVMGWTVLSLRGMLANLLDTGAAGAALTLVLSAALGALVYFAGLAVLGCPEAKNLGAIVLKRKGKPC